MKESGRRGRRARRQTKDRVLQARIPEQLDAEIRDRAEQLGLSVSTVVRNVLLHTFDLVEGVVSDSAQLARAIQGHNTPSPGQAPALPDPDYAEPDAPSAVIGWQEAILNRNGVCEQCNKILARGERAAVGVPVQARPVLLCLECLAALLPGTEQAPTTERSATKTQSKQEAAAPAKASRRRKKPGN